MILQEDAGPESKFKGSDLSSSLYTCTHTQPTKHRVSSPSFQRMKVTQTMRGGGNSEREVIKNEMDYVTNEISGI